MKLSEEFLDYCTHYAYNKKRTNPANPRTIERYRRGLRHVEKLLGKSLDTLSDADQLQFITKITQYPQGTRRVDTQIFQRFIAWGIKNKKLTCSNLLLGREAELIGEDTPVTYANISKADVERFLGKIERDENRLMFALIYYSGLTAEEVCQITPQHVLSRELAVNRHVLRDTQILEMPIGLHKELRTFAEEHEEQTSLFDLPLNPDNGRQRVYARYTSESARTQELLGTRFRDYRVAAIRHFFQDTLNPELTKQFAGVPNRKGGWLDLLITNDDVYLSKAMKARKYYGKK